MKKFFKIVGLILLAFILFVLIAGLFVPKHYELQKDITINAPKERVWQHVNSLQQLDKWSPWSEQDPNIKISYEGQEGAVGSVYKWEGNSNVGKGSQTLTKIDPGSRVESSLHFIKPFEGNANAFIQLSDAGTATKVTWGFDTDYKYPMNVMQLFFDMDDMMGKQYNAGLAKLKTLAEAN